MVKTFSIQKKNIVIVFLISILCCITPLLADDGNFIYTCLIGINSFFANFFMLNDSKRPYTLSKLINFFILVFFILANSIQFVNHSNVLTFYILLTKSDYIFFQVVVFIILLLYNFLHDIFQNKVRHVKVRNNKDIYYYRILIVSCIATFLILAHYHFNIYSLFFRGLTRELLDEYSVSKSSSGSVAGDLIFGKVIRSIPWSAYILSCCIGCNRKQRVLLFFPMLLTVFPTGLSRNAAAMYWIAVFVLRFEKYLKRNRFIYVMFIGIFIAFPFLNNFRVFGGDFRINLSLDYLDSMHMDASQIFMASMHVNRITWGRQLLGALLFFVPRSIWPSKPVGSGHYFVISQHGTFTNVSFPFFAEGYINFGFVGIILFIIVLAYITGKFDGKFWLNHRFLEFKPTDVFYLILLGAMIYIMRGDLMSSLAYTIGICLSYYIVLTISRI